MNGPLRFAPFLRPMVWGGRRLGEILGKPLPAAEPYGESWEVSDHPLHYSVVATGPRSGETLRTLMEEERPALLGTEISGPAQFPWLVKFLDASDWLSVQVHPDETAVSRLWPGEGSKTEAWFVLDAAPRSRIYAGLLPGVDETRLRAALAAGDVTHCLHSIEPRAGDCVFLPAGTVHAVGGGVLMAEVQQTSDATFRLSDWNRRDAQGKARTLHIDESMQAIHWDQGPIEPVRAALDATGTLHQTLVRCRYFHLHYLRSDAPFSCGGEGKLQLAIVVHGQGHFRFAGGEEAVQFGQTWVFPATMPRISCQPSPELGLLVSTLP
jgi:mannose-6-phosphate isomerase